MADLAFLFGFWVAVLVTADLTIRLALGLAGGCCWCDRPAFSSPPSRACLRAHPVVANQLDPCAGLGHLPSLEMGDRIVRLWFERVATSMLNAP